MTLIKLMVLALAFISYRKAEAINNSKFISMSITDSEGKAVDYSMITGASYTARIAFQNTGDTPWDPNAKDSSGNSVPYNLGSQSPQDNEIWGFRRVRLASIVAPWINAPGGIYEFVFSFKAPNVPGTYYFRWQMVQEAIGWFGEKVPSKAFSVASPDQAEIVSIEVRENVQAEKYFTAKISVKNTGITTWSEENKYRLGSQNPRDNSNWGTARMLLSKGITVKPGDTYTFFQNVRAPKDVGKYNFQWQMVREGVRWFGSISENKVINVRRYVLGTGYLGDLLLANESNKIYRFNESTSSWNIIIDTQLTGGYISSLTGRTFVFSKPEGDSLYSYAEGSYLKLQASLPTRFKIAGDRGNEYFMTIYGKTCEIGKIGAGSFMIFCPEPEYSVTWNPDLLYLERPDGSGASLVGIAYGILQNFRKGAAYDSNGGYHIKYSLSDFLPKPIPSFIQQPIGLAEGPVDAYPSNLYLLDSNFVLWSGSYYSWVPWSKRSEGPLPQ